jgi:hypothetical protein
MIAKAMESADFFYWETLQSDIICKTVDEPSNQVLTIKYFLRLVWDW